MTKRRKIQAGPTKQIIPESMSLTGREPTDPPRKNSGLLLGSFIAFTGWLAFLIWLAVA